MGPCASAKKSRNNPLDEFDKLSLNIQDYKNKQLPKLGFQALLSNVKIKSCPYPAISIKFTINDVQSFGLAKKELGNDCFIKWKIQHTLCFEMTLYELMKQFLIIEIFDEQQNQIGNIKINLYNISVGPYHQDFAIHFVNDAIGRISFDIRISQIIELKLQSTQSEISLNTSHPGQIFNYSIKTIVNNSHSLISFPSYSVSIVFDKQDKIQTSQDNLTCSNRKRMTFYQKQIQFGNNLVWNKQQSYQLPCLQMNVLVSDLYHSCFQILLWKLNEKNMTNNVPKPELYAQCYISFQKLFHNSCIIKDEANGFELRQQYIQEKLWLNGKQVGKGKFKLLTSSSKYLKQMQACVRTQQGILNNSPVFTSHTQGTSQELIQLLKISDQIQTSIISLQKINQSAKMIMYEVRSLHRSIQKNLKKMIPLMIKSSKQSLKFYNYKSKQQLLKAQKLFITIGTKVLDYIEEEDQNITELCLTILTCIISRGQFTLSYIGFDQNQKKHILKDNKDKFLKSKIQIALLYQQFIHKILQLALNLLHFKGVEYQRRFAENFCAYVYFRIPLFRTQILQSICKDNDPQILQWRGIQFSLNEDIDYSQIKQDSNTFTIFFDWNNSFHKCIQKQQKYQSNVVQLFQILSKTQWKQKMARRGKTFFEFIQIWVTSVEQIGIIVKDIQWKYLPGYNRLLRSFLVEMKKRNILQYPDALLITCVKLLSNQNLLNIFVSILLSKANMNEPLTVLKAISLINLLLETLTERKHRIPALFNYLFFFKAIKIILQSEFSYAISQTLSLIYTYFPLFSLQFKRNFSMYLLGKVFFRLFLHWSNNVRLAFYHLITFRVYQEALVIHINEEQSQKFKYKYQMVKNCLLQNQQIKQKYEKLINILVLVEEQKYQAKQKMISVLYEKDLFKRMKNKLLLKNWKITEQTVETSSYQTMSVKQIKKVKLYHQKLSHNIVQKPKHQRTQSLLVQNNPLTQLLKNSKSNGNQQVKRYKKSSFTHENQLYDVTQTNSQKNASIQLIEESQFELIPYTQEQINYINIGMKEFNQINSKFLQMHHQNKIQIPALIIQIPIDEKEIRPDRIDDW